MKETMLAIVIPFYKRKYFFETLLALKSQTDQRFNIYIGDDASPDSLADLLEQLGDDEWVKRKINYTRFAENLGRKSLVKHWERCVGLTNDEEWIWLFSDDDRMDANCVEQFYKKLSVTATPYSLYKFYTEVIDANGSVIKKLEPIKSGLLQPFDLIYEKLKGRFHTFAVEYIFSRTIFNSTGGFVDFPLAWGSDDATWVKFAGEHEICLIPVAMVQWRTSDINISGNISANGLTKTYALLQYGQWIVRHFRHHTRIAELRSLMKNFIIQQVDGYLGAISPVTAIRIYQAGTNIWGWNPKVVASLTLHKMTKVKPARS